MARFDPFFDAVLFDLDGTLLDSERLGPGIVEQILAESARVLSTEEQKLLQQIWCYHSTFKEFEKALSFHFSEVCFEVNWKIFFETFYQRYLLELDKTSLMPSALELLENLHGKTVMGLVTGSRRAQVRFIMERFSLERFFKVIVTEEDAAPGKPHPLPFLTACKSLGADPARSLAIENSNVGVSSAKVAGLTVFAVSEGNLISQDLSHAHYQFGTLQELALELSNLGIPEQTLARAKV